MINWQNTIKIKKYFTDDNTNDSVLNVIEKLIPQLEFVVKVERKKIDNIKNEIIRENMEYTIEQLEEIIEEFQFVKNCIKDKENSIEYSFNSWTEAFNCYLEGLYNIGDTLVNANTKFLWVS